MTEGALQPIALVAEIDGPHHHGRLHRGSFTTRAIQRDVDQVAQLVHGGHSVVPRLELLSELRDRGHDRGHDDLGGHELAKRELLVQHQPATHTKQQRACQDLQREKPRDLPKQHTEMLRTGLQITTNQIIGPALGHLHPARALEHARMPRELLEPVHHLILADRLADAGRNRAAAKHEDDQGDRSQQKQRESQQERVIEGEHREPDRGVQHQVDAGQQQHRSALLHRDHVQEAVHQLRRVHAAKRLHVHRRQPGREIRGQPNEDAPLDHLGDHVLDRAECACDSETDEQHQRDRGERLQERSALRAEGQVAHEAVDGQRKRQIEQARDRAEHRDRPQLRLLGPHQRDQSADGRHVMPFRAELAMRIALADALGDDQTHVDTRITAQGVTQGGAANEAGLRIRLRGTPATRREEAVATERKPSTFRLRPCDDGERVTGDPDRVGHGETTRFDANADRRSSRTEHVQWLARVDEVHRRLGARGLEFAAQIGRKPGKQAKRLLRHGRSRPRGIACLVG